MIGNAQQFARRLLVNILVANGDAHLKNWSLIYPDTVTPELAPAYDIGFTRATWDVTDGSCAQGDAHCALGSVAA
jgi:serine/threonine protein kinase HipA of HipAB toxin-antitoxin module